MARKRRDTTLPAPFLKRVTLIPDRMGARDTYPFSLPYLTPEFEVDFDQPVTILVGENGTGKSTLIEALAAMAGYGSKGGGKGYTAMDDKDGSGTALGAALRGAWLPKVTNGWFFRAETFFDVTHILQTDYLAASHGEGFVQLFSDRMQSQGIYFMDEPESALSPHRQRRLLRFLAQTQASARAQIIMATHSPILMAVPGAQLLQITRDGLAPVALADTLHFRLYRDFVTDPKGFVAETLEEDA